MADLRQLGEAAALGDRALVDHLRHLNTDDMSELLRISVPELREILLRMLRGACVEIPQSVQRTTYIPAHLPEELQTRLREFKARLEERHRRLIRNGHNRSPEYVARAVRDPVRLAKFLADKGISRWDVMRKRDIVAFLKGNPNFRAKKLDRFLRFLNENTPFRERRGRPPAKRFAERRNLTPPKIVPPEVLRDLLKQIRATRSDAEYLLAWLVCRMAMRLKDAYALTLNLVRVDDSGQLVIRPAKIWVVVGKPVAAVFRRVIAGVAADWPNGSGEFEHTTIFEHYIRDPDAFSAAVLQRRATQLRTSAIFAAMLEGHLDRVTLSQTMGVSTPTIAKLELLLSADMHRRVDPDIVARRNDVILGRDNG